MKKPYIVVLGTAQDAGYPSIGCDRPCCASAWENPAKRRFVASLGIVDPASRKRWLIDCTPDFKDQLRLLDEHTAEGIRPCPHGIFLTHAHIGHYAGLMQLGREALGARLMPVHALPRMAAFLRENGPWSQLVELENILIQPMSPDRSIEIGNDIIVTPLLVPHRGEYSETAGFRIAGKEKTVLYIPDIDHWDRLETPLEELLAGVDLAYLDATFYSSVELGKRDMAEIPHPPVTQTMRNLAGLAKAERAKVRFIHFNHTNPLLIDDSEAVNRVYEMGFGLAEQGEEIRL